MANKKFGAEPEQGELILSKGADLVFRLPPTDVRGAPSTWPDGTTSTLQLLTAKPSTSAETVTLSQGGVVDPTAIEYIIQSSVTDPIINTSKWFRLYISLPESPTQEYLIYYGFVKRKD